MKYSISDVAKEFGITTSAIRWYEKQGIIPAIKRDANGRRYYDEGDLDWFSVVMCMKETGMSIENICRFAQLNSEGDSTLQQRLAMVEKQRAEVLHRIEALEKNLKIIDFKIMYFKESIKEGTEFNMKRRYYASHIHQRLEEKEQEKSKD